MWKLKLGSGTSFLKIRHTAKKYKHNVALQHLEGLSPISVPNVKTFYNMVLWAPLDNLEKEEKKEE